MTVTEAIRAGAVDEPLKMLIAGEHVEAAGGKTLVDYDPATGTPLARLAAGSKQDVDRAVAAARAALEGKEWGRMAPADRGRLLYQFSELIRAHHDELSRLETQDVGKPLR